MKQHILRSLAVTAILTTLIGVLFVIPYSASAAGGRERLLEKDWIILQVPIPYPGCTGDKDGSNEFVKCCNNPDVVDYYAGINASRLTSKRPTIGCFGVAAVKDAPALVVVLAQFITFILAIFVVIVLMIAGAAYITSGGSPDKAKKATDMAKHAAASLVIVLFSVVLLNQINPALIKLTVTGIVKIENVALVSQCPEAQQTKCGDKVPGYEDCRGLMCDPGNYCKVEKDKSACAPQLATNAECTIDEMCKSGACAALIASPEKKQCFSLQTHLGSFCSDTKPCEGTLICQTDTAGNHCTFGYSGDPCDNDAQCAASAGYVCIEGIINGDEFCSPAKVPYGRCSSNSDCPDGHLCTKGYYSNNLFGNWGSDNDLSTCLPESKSVANEPVKLKDCNTNAHCLENTEDDTQFCNTDGDHFCTKGFAGSPCKENDQCSSGFCASIPNICTNGIVGDRCDSHLECLSGLCYKEYCIGKEI